MEKKKKKNFASIIIVFVVVEWRMASIFLFLLLRCFNSAWLRLLFYSKAVSEHSCCLRRLYKNLCKGSRRGWGWGWVQESKSEVSDFLYRRHPRRGSIPRFQSAMHFSPSLSLIRSGINFPPSLYLLTYPGSFLGISRYIRKPVR